MKPKTKLPPYLSMQTQLGTSGGHTYFNVGSPKKKGKKMGKRTPKKREKKGSGSLAPFGVMPEGQKTLEEMVQELLN